MIPSENPNDYPDYQYLKFKLACEEFQMELLQIVEPVMKWMLEVIQKLQEVFKQLSEKLRNFLMKIYGNKKSKRLIRLALYAKKDRVRKKNIRRILKIISK